MAAIKKFEDLEIWQMALRLYHELGEVFYDFHFKNYHFRDQIMRAALSVPNNIAEGFERAGVQDRKRFFSYAKGSTGEVRSMLYSACYFSYISHEKQMYFVGEYTKLTQKIYMFTERIR